MPPVKKEKSSGRSADRKLTMYDLIYDTVSPRCVKFDLYLEKEVVERIFFQFDYFLGKRAIALMKMIRKIEEANLVKRKLSKKLSKP